MINLNPQLVLPNIFIIIEENIGDELYFLAKGKVKVYIRGYLVNTLREGASFGEIALFLHSCRRTASCVASLYCDLFSIKAKILNSLLLEYREDAIILQEQSKTRFYKTEEFYSNEFKKRLHIDNYGVKHKHIWRDFDSKKDIIIQEKFKNMNLEKISEINGDHYNFKELFNIKSRMIRSKRQLEYSRRIIKNIYSIEKIPNEILMKNPKIFKILKKIMNKFQINYNNENLMMIHKLEDKFNHRINSIEERYKKMHSFYNELYKISFYG